jgi:stress response protein YsnF
MLSERQISTAIGSTAYGVNGEKLGTVEHFYSDDRTGAPSWVAVTTGLFGVRHSIVPAVDASFQDGRLSLPVTADQVKSAPQITGDHLDPADEAMLRRHYGEPGGDHADDVEQPTRELRMPPPPVPTEAPTQPAAGDDGSMTRSEEQLRVDTERVATSRARLVKYVVTEEVQITVPIRREEIRVEEVPVDAPDPGPGESLLDHDELSDRGTGSGSGLPDEIILHTERPVVTVEVVPTERVRLRTELVEGQETVTDQVQREQVVVDETPSSGISPRRS